MIGYRAAGSAAPEEDHQPSEEGSAESQQQQLRAGATSPPGVPPPDTSNLATLVQFQQQQRRWATSLTMECAGAISRKDPIRIQQLLWMLNELSSPYGDRDQRLASCFLQALFCRVTGTGSRQHKLLCSAAERHCLFDPMRRLMLKFQEMSPWICFSHVAANGALLEAVEGEFRVHIIDVSSTMCTQWPTLLEALATRSDGAPHLRLTSVLLASTENDALVRVMNEVGARLRKFARLMGVPFEFRMIQRESLAKLDMDCFQLRSGEALIVNCVQSLHICAPGSDSNPNPIGGPASDRDAVLGLFRGMNPKLMILVEDEVELVAGDFVSRTGEAVRFYSLFFESLEESFARTSNERLALERVAGRKIVNLLACDESGICDQRQEKSGQWSSRLRRAGFAFSKFSDDVADDVRALLKRYREGWGYNNTDSALFLTWKDQPTIFASTWKPC